MRRVLLIIIVILLVFVGAANYYIYFFPRDCSVEVKSSESLQPKLTVTDKNSWKLYISSLAACDKGFYNVYDLAGFKDNKATSVRKISYILTGNRDDLISFRNSKTNEVYFRWKIELDAAQNSANVYLYIPYQDTENLEKYTFAAIYSTSIKLFKIDNATLNKTELRNFTNLHSLGLAYEKN